MTWEHLNRTALAVGICLFSTHFAHQARAEGGEGASVIIEHDRQAAVQEPAEAPAGEVEQAEAEAAPETKLPKTKVKSAARMESAAETEGEAKPAPAKAKAKKTKAEPQTADVEASPDEPAAVEAATPTATSAQKDKALALKPDADEKPPASKSPRKAVADAARGTELQALIQRYSAQNNIPYPLADAVIRIESRYNIGARNGPHMGLTQIHAATARSLGYAGEASGLLDAETNLRYGLKYLATAYRLAGGDTCGTILRYQAGHRAETMTAAARKYCARVKIITAGAE